MRINVPSSPNVQASMGFVTSEIDRIRTRSILILEAVALAALAMICPFWLAVGPAPVAYDLMRLDGSLSAEIE